MKTNKTLLTVTSTVTLFPILWGLMIWSQLPNQIPIHFNVADQADNFQSKPLVVFGLPILLLLVHLFVIFMIGRDPKNRTMNEKMVKVIYWLIPIVSLIVSYLIYSKALGSTTNPSVFVSYEPNASCLYYSCTKKSKTLTLPSQGSDLVKADTTHNGHFVPLLHRLAAACSEP